MEGTSPPPVPTITITPEPTFVTADPPAYIDDYLANPKRKPPLSAKSRILPILAHRRIEAAAAKEYITAARLARAEKDLRDYFHSLENRDRAVRSVETAATPSSGLISRLQTTWRRFEHKIEHVRRERENAMAELRLSHEHELKEFQEKWASPGALKPFSKPSPNLLQLREIERRKVLLMDYEGAEQTRRQADLLEMEETARARDRIIRGRQSNVEQIRRRQQMEIEAADRLTRKKLCHLENERDAAVVPLRRQLERAKQRERNEPDVIRVKHDRGQRERSPRDEGDDVDLPSPRTFRRISHMRAAVVSHRLSVGGGTGDERSETKRRRAHSVQRSKPG
jgi:hypothetical protein